MGYRKGLDVALAAVADARRDVPGLRLTVVGVPPGKPADGVDWLGVIPQARMAEVYGQADLLLFPTRYESFGLVVIEAMAAGLPVIVSDAIGSGIVTDGLNGVVISGHDPSRYAEALRRLADPAVRATIARTNLEDARRFSIESAGADYAAVAESLAGTQQISGRTGTGPSGRQAGRPMTARACARQSSLRPGSRLGRPATRLARCGKISAAR